MLCLSTCYIIGGRPHSHQFKDCQGNGKNYQQVFTGTGFSVFWGPESKQLIQLVQGHFRLKYQLKYQNKTTVCRVFGLWVNENEQGTY